MGEIMGERGFLTIKKGWFEPAYLIVFIMVAGGGFEPPTFGL
jgi:hypothetical protein